MSRVCVDWLALRCLALRCLVYTSRPCGSVAAPALSPASFSCRKSSATCRLLIFSNRWNQVRDIRLAGGRALEVVPLRYSGGDSPALVSWGPSILLW